MDIYSYREQIIFYGLDGHGIQSFLWSVWSIALSVAPVPIASYPVASNLYVLPIVRTVVQLDGTSILSLHSSLLLYYCLSFYMSVAIYFICIGFHNNILSGLLILSRVKTA